MPLHRRCAWTWTLALLVSCVALGTVPPAGAADAAAPASLQDAFDAAAREFGVPLHVLLALGYHQSRWEHHRGAPSTSGGYGIMHLIELDQAAPGHTAADGRARARAARFTDPAFHTLTAAAALLGLSRETVARDARHNIRGGAALLAQYARETVGFVPTDAADWYGALVRFSGSAEAAVAVPFADGVYATIRSGVTRTTMDGQTVTLAAQPVTPNITTAAAVQLRPQQERAAECPPELACRFVPAAYTLNNPDDPSDYGNYDVAQRPEDGLDLRYIVIHDTEIPYATTIAAFQNPASYVSAHYVLRAADGEVTQMVANRDVAWGAGNWYVNMHAINIEHEGVAIEGAAWYSEAMYRASARLVRYLADRYSIALDRSHIIGHDDVPGPTPPLMAQQHWDPGPFWDWAHYMALIGAPIEPGGDAAVPELVTIAPRFASNTPPLEYCLEDGCRDVPPQPSSFVYMYQAPSFDAPLVDDPHLAGPGSRQAYDWGDKAATGQRFYRVAREGEWDAIFFNGQLAWFHNPGGTTNTRPGSGTLLTPRDGLERIPVYGRAYPEAAAYAADMTPEPIVPLDYTIPAGQIYVGTELVTADYYWSPTQTQRRVVEGQAAYYVIFFNHRLAFLDARDVRVVEVIWQSNPLPAEGGTTP